MLWWVLGFIALRELLLYFRTSYPLIQTGWVLRNKKF